MKEKFTIRIKENVVEIECANREKMRFSAGEALMVLDILKNEEENLRKMADEASPIPIRIK